ncbi:AN1 zinc finger protein [Hortaea werneckii]|nr:AN1 zinc finger protein [Hortaea werneckii]KAI7019890.1 AN1 zinc finger protein [Hortaea werneckii]
MATADVEAIGAHCQHPYCHQLDFLPFKCDSCKGTYCLDHRSETAHQCPKAGEWARRRAQLENHSSGPSTPRPNILTHEKQCAEPSCKTLIDTPLVTGVHCDKCNRSYCLKHRFTNDHNCTNLTPIGARPTPGPTQRERGLAALDKLRAWGLKKKETLPRTPQTKTKAAAAQRIQETANLKRTAKGDSQIPPEKRIYLYVEASSDTLTAKIPKGTFYYNREYTIGRILDLAAKSLQVSGRTRRQLGSVGAGWKVGNPCPTLQLSDQQQQRQVRCCDAASLGPTPWAAVQRHKTGLAPLDFPLARPPRSSRTQESTRPPTVKKPPTLEEQKTS